MSARDFEATHSTTLQEIQAIVRDLLDNDDILLRPDTRPSEVEGWDSLANVNIIFSLEEVMGIRLEDGILGGYENVGELVQIVNRARNCPAA